MTETILGLAVIGFIAWLIVTYVPMPAPVRAVIIVLVVIWLIVRVVPLVGIKLP